MIVLQSQIAYFGKVARGAAPGAAAPPPGFRVPPPGLAQPPPGFACCPQGRPSRP